MKRINNVFFNKKNNLQNNKNSENIPKSIDKSAEMDYLWKAHITFAESMGTVFSGKSLWHSNNTSGNSISKKERKTTNSNDMKIISSKLISTQERGSLTIWNILSFIKRKEMFIYEFEVEVPASTLSINDNLLGANHLKLLVINKLSETKFVLRTTELHPCPPFMGVDLIVIARSFSEGLINFCKTTKESYDGNPVKKYFLGDEVGQWNFKHNELFCDKWKNNNVIL